jgi:hypothetical protein
MKTRYLFSTLVWVLTSVIAFQLSAAEKPAFTKKEPGRKIEKFSGVRNSDKKMAGSKKTFVVKDQMLHYYNGEGYDTAATFHYEYIWSVLVSEILTKDYINGSFENSQLELHFRDDQGRDTTVVQQYWDSVKKGWKNNWKEVMLFDEYGNEVFYGLYVWNLEEWLLDWGSEMVYEYDTQGRILSITYFYYSWGNWDPDWKNIMVYDESGLLLAMSELYWDKVEQEWINNYLEEYHYVNNEWSEIFGFLWDEMEEEWMPALRIKDLVWVNFNTFLWDSYTLMVHDGVDWVDYERASATYNTMELPLSILFEIWSGTSWMYDWRSTWVYDSFLNLTLMTDEGWSGVAWILIWGYSFDYEYDANNNVAVEYLEVYYDTGKGWEKVHKLENWYEDVSGIPVGQIKLLSVHVYPNPAGNYLNIEVDGFSIKSPVHYQILDFAGRTVMTGQIDSNHSAGAQLNLQDISAGVYLLRVESGNLVERIKIIRR